MGSGCSKCVSTEESYQNEILKSETNLQSNCQQISKNFINSNPNLNAESKNQSLIEVNNNENKSLIEVNNNENKSLIEVNNNENKSLIEKHQKQRYFEFDYRKIIQTYISDFNLDQSFKKYSNDTNHQEVNDLAFEFICHVAILHFCFQQINHNSVRNLLNTQISQIIYSLLTFTNIKGSNFTIWGLFIQNWLQQIVNIYERELQYINKIKQNNSEGNESQEKQELIKTLEQFKQQQEVPQIKQLIAINALEYFNKKEAFSFITEGKAKQIRLIGRVHLQ